MRNTDWMSRTNRKSVALAVQVLISQHALNGFWMLPIHGRYNFIIEGLHRVMRARLLCAIRGVPITIGRLLKHSSFPKSRKLKGQAYGLSMRPRKEDLVSWLLGGFPP